MSEAFRDMIRPAVSTPESSLLWSLAHPPPNSVDLAKLLGLAWRLTEHPNTIVFIKTPLFHFFDKKKSYWF